ncbi:acetyl-CoA hydrolase/transferase C-terminal domain-containing protein [Nocardioides sp.]|uniref:acetyl-CoA hydrolase/transferase C-terminal domain-containing protein n=1 Tax=Nocardioides sp. TaxID=35761 RepID=UPI00261A86B3|nr:acetyl-CoA hydrolase/transferase C-terminal domain-containing protein [Nocardioides sp.]
MSLAALLTPGCRVAVADGLGAPRSASAELSRAAAGVGGVQLVLGWLPTPDPDLDLTSYHDVAALMGGWGMRDAIRAGYARGIPVRWSQVPGLMQGRLRPDILLAGVVPARDGGLTFGSEVSWMHAAVAAGAQVAAVVHHGAPRAYDGPSLPAEHVVVVGESSVPLTPLGFTAPDDVHREVADRVAGLVPAGARIQVGPGALGSAIMAAVTVPVRVDSGLLVDGILDLERRGLLLGTPIGTYLAGGEKLLAWADGRGLLHPVEHTHDPTRLSTGEPFVSINTALEIDTQGNVGIEGPPDKPVASPGGHPDYAAAGARSAEGLSIIALPTAHRGRPALVDRLSGPVTTPGHDVDVVVTERGTADLRGLDRVGRSRALTTLWE